MVTKLCFKKGLPNLAANRGREVLQVLSAGANKNGGFDRAEQIFHRIRYISIYQIVKGANLTVVMSAEEETKSAALGVALLDGADDGNGQRCNVR